MLSKNPEMVDGRRVWPFTVDIHHEQLYEARSDKVTKANTNARFGVFNVQ